MAKKKNSSKLAPVRLARTIINIVRGNPRTKKVNSSHFVRTIIKPINIAFLSLIVGVIFFARFVGATTKVGGPLEVTYDGDTIFSETNLAPGDTVSKNITVKNNGSVAHSFAIATENVSGDLSDDIIITPSVDGVDQWSKTIDELSKLAEESITVVGSIDPDQTKSVTLKAEFADTNGDENQLKNLTFDVVFGTQEAEPVAEVPGGFATLLGRGTVTAGEEATSQAEESKTEEGDKNKDEGDVKGAESESGVGENFWLLLIVPVVAVGALATMSSSVVRNVGMPLFSGAVAVILSNYIKGQVDPTVFWSVLGGEILVTGGIKIVLGDRHRDWYQKKRKKKK